MRRAWTIGWVMPIVLMAQAAWAGAGDPRFAPPPPAAMFSTGSCEPPGSPNGVDRAWQISWITQSAPESSPPRALPGLALGVFLSRADLQAQQTAVRRPVAVEYSRGYDVRHKIHKYASIATVPLFVTEVWLGESLYNHPGESESKQGAHGAVAASIGVLFGVNTVTGVWNLAESRKNPAGRTRRTVHGVLMLAADAGFVATGLLAPHEEGGEEGGTRAPVTNSGSRSTHRAVALTSMGVALASYLMMLIWKD